MTPTRAWTLAKWGGAVFLVALPLHLLAVRSIAPGDLRITRAFQDLHVLRTLLANYRKTQGVLPRDDPGLGELVQQNLLDRPLRDPWGAAYVYRRANNDAGYILYSPGANGIDEGGSGDDVTDWSKHYECRTYGLDCPFPGAQWPVLGLAALALAGLLGFLWFGGAALRGRLAGQRSKSGFPPAPQ